jgi:hypothetical protein
MNAVIGARDAAGRIMTWHIELSDQYGIEDARRDVADLVWHETQQQPRVVLACIQGDKS